MPESACAFLRSGTSPVPGAYTRPLFGSTEALSAVQGVVLGVAEGVFGRCQGVLGDVQGAFCVRNGSGSAEKWTSVSPCPVPPDSPPGSPAALPSPSAAPSLSTPPAPQGLTLAHVRAQLEQLQDTFIS